MSNSARRYQGGNGGRKQGDVHNPSKGKAKFVEMREDNARQNPVRPMNPKQKTYMDLMDTKDIIIATGWSGTSKTYLATAIACDLLRIGKIDKIVFCRPNISNSTSLGMFAGTAEEKLSQWISPMLSVVKERMGEGALEVAIKRGDIEFQPLETIKGMSLNSGWLIVDEAEDLTIDEAKKVITRVGEGGKIILAGDLMQSELKEHSGLKWLVEFAQRQQLDDIIGHIDFNHVNDIVRSNAVKRIIIAMNRDSKGGVK